MTRPQIIRADTIDLQDQESPSAKDHSRHHLRPGLLGDGSPAPHQADALKNAELELSEQHGRSPRASQDLSGKELQLLHDEDVANDRDPNENLLRNSNLHGGGMNTDDDMEGIEGDDSLDDDMMDKISSSPSIGEDGGYSSFLASAPPGISSRSFHYTEPPTDLSNDESSSSPFTDTPDYLPLSIQHQALEPDLSANHHYHYHHCQEVLFNTDSANTISIAKRPGIESQDELSPTLSDLRESNSHDTFEDVQSSHNPGAFPSNFEELLLPINDPLLDSAYYETQSDDSSPSSNSTNSDLSWQTHSEASHDSDDNDDDDAATEVSFLDDPRFVDSGWGGECLRETEEIDFDFVYALHTFVATVEGQANATKGDNMVLLDDSNSYWWLVRVVKDSSIGYLPAEHIETPTERLARLNKHRNLDLSQTMLSDQEEDKRVNPLNPLKKAMRRRNVKTVQFAPPSYLEPEEIVTTSDEEDEGHEEEFTAEEHGASQQNQETSDGVEENGLDESSKAREEQTLGMADSHASNQELRNGLADADSATDRSRTSEEVADRSDDGTLARSRKGNMRNTDSFYKDDSVETRKINLTPSLLRDDSSNSATTKSSESTVNLKNRPSLDLIVKDNPAEKVKDEKKKKEKRGMLGGMFKRKDKKSKGSDRETEEAEKTSSDLARQSPQPKESMESLSQDTQTTKITPQPHKQTSKLQKQPPAKLSPKSPHQQPKESIGQKNGVGQPDTAPTQVDTNKTSSTSTELNGTSRLVTSDSQQRHLDETPLQLQGQHRDAAVNNTSPQRLAADEDRQEPRPMKETIFVPPPSAPKVESVGKDRSQSDDPIVAPSGNDESVTTETSSEHESRKSSAEMTLSKPTTAQQHHLAIAQAAQYESLDVTGDELYKAPSREHLSESPVQVLPQDSRQDPQLQPRVTPHQPPPLIADTSSIEEPSTSSLRSSSSSPEPIERPSDVVNATAESPKDDNDDEDREKSGSIREETLTTITPASSAPAEHPTPSSTSTTPTWSDASLRAYLDSDDGDIRDLLLVVHDKTGVKPRRDHPVVQSLYREENRRLDALSSNLDNLLGQYLARKKSGRKTDGELPVR